MPVRTQSFIVGSTLAWGQVEAVKWLAFALMLGDHLNAYLFGYGSGLAYLGGRLVLPLFAFCLAFGFVQASHGSQSRVLRRLVVWGIVAQLPWLAFEHGVYVLNVMGTLWAGCAAWYAVQRARSWRIALWLLAVIVVGGVSEYGIAGVLVVLSACWFFARRDLASAAAVLASLLLLQPINGTYFALASVLVWLGARFLPEVPRARGLFYKAYAAQWAALWAVRVLWVF